MCAGFPAAGRAHHLVNRTELDVLYLEIGDRAAGDEGFYRPTISKQYWVPTGKGFSLTRVAQSISGCPLREFTAKVRAYDR